MINRSTRSKVPLPFAAVKPTQPLTIDYSTAAQRRRVVERANQRIAQQRKTRFELKAKKAPTKTVTPGISLRPPAINSTQPLVRKLLAVLPAAAAEPRLSPKGFRALEFATKCMQRPDWSPNQKRLAAFFHLQQDPLTATLSPDDLISEHNTPNSCSLSQTARSIE